MWTRQQRWCTVCAVAVIVAFAAASLYINPTGLSLLNPFSTEECEPYKHGKRLDDQNYPRQPVSIIESGERARPTEGAKNGTDQPQNKSDSATDLYACRLAVYTHQLAVFTALLAVATIILIGIGIGQAYSLHRAARAAERALSELERPWLFIQGTLVTWRDSPLGPGRIAMPGIFGTGIPNDWYIKLILKNVGRMPAVVERIEFKIREKTSLTAMPDYSGSSLMSCQRTFAADSEGETREVGPAGGNPNPVVFFGRVTYTELSGHEHHTGFAFDMAPSMPICSPYNNTAYDYYD